MSGAIPLTKQEHSIVKNQFDSLRNKCLYVLGHSTGFRISELLSVSVSQVLNCNSLKIERKNIKGKTQSREVVLNSEAKEAIKEYIEATGLKDGPLFISRKGHKAISRITAHRVYKEAFAKAGLNGSYSTHSTRKSFAMKVYKNSDHDLLLTQRALGHSSIMTTVKYLPTDQEKLNKLILEE